MIGIPELAGHSLPTTDGEIAVINLVSARRRAWSRFLEAPLLEGRAEAIVEHERLTGQFLGDVHALDQLDDLVKQLVQADPGSARTTLVQAQVASMAHRFADARQFLAEADRVGAPSVAVRRLSLNIDQACGANLDNVLNERREIAKDSTSTQDLIALAALLADLREFTDADRAYRQALRTYQDVSPFPVAWTYFQLGVLWGELVPEPKAVWGEGWYRKAIDCLPGYTQARLHLAEICSSSGRPDEAEALLIPVVASGNPEVRWRLADALAGQKRYAEAEAQMQAARSGFDALLDRHLLAFADHGAEFYAGRSDWGRALGLARLNAANRPTLRAFEQAHDIATNARNVDVASELLAQAAKLWGSAAAFHSSLLAERSLEKLEGAAL